MISQTQAIAAFLNQKTHTDLAALYSENMEVQVNVAQDGGERYEGEYKGRAWAGWTDGRTIWKPIRIPRHANTKPEYEPTEMKFDLLAHADGIGMTGWDWKNKVSKWVAFDFDSITNHAKGLTLVELQEIENAVREFPWITIRKSTSGRGIHLYIFLDDYPTENHTEHASLARAILGRMSALTRFDFQSKVDTCGGNMWVWARKMIGTDGLSLIKQGTKLPENEIPANWRDHIKVITGSRRKILPQEIIDVDRADLFEELSGQRPRIPLDEDHKRLIDYLREKNTSWWWDADHHMLVSHTADLKDAHDDLNMRGFYDTASKGGDRNTQNCYLFPQRKGAWMVRRYTPGVQEHESWDQDNQGWTRCYLNRDPDLNIAARAMGGTEDPSGGFVFREAEVASKAAALLGATIDVPPRYSARETTLKHHKDGRLIVEIKLEGSDNASDLKGWLNKKTKWVRVLNCRMSSNTEPEIGNYDDMVRHLVTPQGEDYGWVMKIDGSWCVEPLSHIKIALGSAGLSPKESTNVLGTSIFAPWTLVNIPFQDEYLGDRKWNRNAAQFKYQPSSDRTNLYYPTWLKIFKHLGKHLNSAVKDDPWCRANAITTGADYLMCWIASLFQAPTEPLPYLFFHGPEDCGKSIIHEAVGMLMTRGYKRADTALTSASAFNAELEGMLLCVVEEVNLSQSPLALNRIKDWVTGREILIHAKNETPYHAINTTHWIQCANHSNYCPTFPGDTRITVIYVEALDPLEMIPKREIIKLLEKEASDFLAAILAIEIPETNSRLNIPIVTTESKRTIQQSNMLQVDLFFQEKCSYAPGEIINYRELYEIFLKTYCDAREVGMWTLNKFGKHLPQEYTKGKSQATAQWCIGNIHVEGKPREAPSKMKYVLSPSDILRLLPDEDHVETTTQ